MLEVPSDLSDNNCMMNEIKEREVTFIPPVRPTDNGWIKDDGVLYELNMLREDDYEGHCWLYAAGRALTGEGGEWISYDDGETWQDLA